MTGRGPEASPARLARRWGPPAAVAGAVLVGAVVPVDGGSAGPAWFVGLDKWLHALAFAALAVTLAAALADGRTAVRVLALAVGAAVAYGALVETLQAPLATRHASPADLAADAVGALAGALAWLAARRGTDAPPG